MRRPRHLSDVVRFGLCAGCGLCESMSRGAMPMRLNAEGYLRPDIPPDLDPALEERVLSVCPGIHPGEDARAFSRALPGKAQRGHPSGIASRQTGGSPSRLGHLRNRSSALWGAYRGIFLGHANDEPLRFAASSGGVVTAAAAHLLQQGAADAVLHVTADTVNPLHSVACLSRSADELRARVGARYCPASPLTLLEAALKDGNRIVVIGKPCDIAAVRNLVRANPGVGGQIVATISFLCAGVPSHQVSRNIIGKYSLCETEVRLLRFRGNGCPGPTRIEAHDGRVFEQSYEETWGNDLNKAIQFRCKICPDSTGERADLVCGDAWEGEDGYPAGKGEGVNVIIARTRRGLDLLDQMRAMGVVTAAPLARARLQAMQPHHARRKSQVVARLIGLMVCGQLVPDYRWLGLMRAAAHGLRATPANIMGMMRRVRNRNNIEHLPVRDGSGAGRIEGSLDPSPRTRKLSGSF